MSLKKMEVICTYKAEFYRFLKAPFIRWQCMFHVIPYYSFKQSLVTTSLCMTIFLFIPLFWLHFLRLLSSGAYPCEKSSMALTWSLSLGEMSWLLASSTVRFTALARRSFRRVELVVATSSNPVLITWPITKGKTDNTGLLQFRVFIFMLKKWWGYL